MLATPSVFYLCTCRRQYPSGNGSVHLSFVIQSHHWLSPESRRISAHIVVFEACSTFTHVLACAGAELIKRSPLSPECFKPYCPHICLGCYQPKRQLLGGLRIPPRKRAFPRCTKYSRLVLNCVCLTIGLLTPFWLISIPRKYESSSVGIMTVG